MDMLLRNCLVAAAGFAVALNSGGCAVISHGEGGNVLCHQTSKYKDVKTASALSTIGIESNDIQTACTNAASKILASPQVMNRALPTFVINESNFTNESHGNFNTNALVDLLRNELINAANGSVHVLKSDAPDVNAADFSLDGRVTDVRQTGVHNIEGYTQIALQVVDNRSNQIVFSDIYSFKKAREKSSFN